MKTNVLIVGSGCSGLYTALNLPQELQITIISKDKLEHSDSFLAQGGICMLKDESDYDSFFEDTLRAGHYKNDKVSVDLMIKSSPDVIKDLIGYGVDFQRDEMVILPLHEKVRTLINVFFSIKIQLVKKLQADFWQPSKNCQM